MAEITATPPQALKGAIVNLTATFYDDAGVAADPGTVTLGITNLAGATIVAAGAATTATTPGATGVRTYALAAQAALDTLTVTWTSSVFGAFTSQHEIVGAFLFTVAELRAVDGGKLGNASTYPSATLELMRARVDEQLESICGVSFVSRYAYVTQARSTPHRLLLYKPNGDVALRVSAVRSVETRTFGTTTWAALTQAELDDVLVLSHGELIRESLGYFFSGQRNVRVGFEHGYARPPREIHDVALTIARYAFSEDILSQRTISLSSEMGTTQFAVANQSLGRYTSLPEVNAVLERYREGTVPIG